MMIAKENSDSIRFSVTWVTVFCLSSDVGASILLTHSLEVTISILNFMIHDAVDFLSCRAFFRRTFLCYCRRFVSDYVSFSASNQLIGIGPRMKWLFRVLSSPSDVWFGVEIWIFDPGIIGSRIDNKGKLRLCFMKTPVHNTVSRQCPRICLRFWGCQSGTRFMNDVIFCCWGHLKWKRCHRRSIIKFWKRITRYGEIVTERVCRSTHEMCVDRHKSGTGTTGEVGVFFFSEFVLVDAMKASVMDVKTFTDVYGVKRTIGRAYPGATSLFYVMWSLNARMPERHTYHIRVRWILEEEYIMVYNMIASKAYRQEASSISLFQLCPLQHMAHKFDYVKVCFCEVVYGLNTVVTFII